MSGFNLPDDLIAFLRAGNQPEYDPTTCEAGAVILSPLDQLKAEFFPMTSEDSADPHAGEGGSYLVTGVSLIASCENYDPIGLLLWLPLDGRYGTWDGEHGTLRVFEPDAKWSEMAGDLPRYVNAQWGLDGSVPVSDLIPWPRHTYNPEQLHHPLPDISEWYEVSWVRRGQVRKGVQVRFPEELKIRVERVGDNWEITSQTKPPSEGATWSPTEIRQVRSQEWDRMPPSPETGFWDQPSVGEANYPGETDTMWTMTGFRDRQFHRLFRSYDERTAVEDPVHEFGVRMARLAGIDRFKTAG